MKPSAAGEMADKRLRRMIIALAMAGLSLPALACSPVLISPLDALQSPGPTARFSRIVLAEVVAARAPARLVELEQWRQEVRATAAAQQQQDELDAAPARIAAATLRGPDDPLPPPPASRLIEPVLPAAVELRTEIDLFVLETIHGAHQDRLSVPAGGPCGSAPRLGQQVLVFIQSNGLAQVLQRPGEGGPQTFDDAFLDQVRACARGECEQPR